MLRRLDEIEEHATVWKREHRVIRWGGKTKYPWAKLGIGDCFPMIMIERETASALVKRANQRSFTKLFILCRVGRLLYCFRVETPDDDSTEWFDKITSAFRRVEREMKYPWGSMAIGDKFTFHQHITNHSCRTQVKAAMRRTGMKFVLTRRTAKRVG